MDKTCKILANEDDWWLCSIIIIAVLIVFVLLAILFVIFCILRNISLRNKLQALKGDDKKAKQNNEQVNLIEPPPQTTNETAIAKPN